jgi:hypothetical protein
MFWVTTPIARPLSISAAIARCPMLGSAAEKASFISKRRRQSSSRAASEARNA